MIKALVLALTFFCWNSLSFAYSFEDFKDEVKTNTRMTIGHGVIPAYYGNFSTGKSKAVGLASVFAYRYLHAVAGIAHGFQKEEKGEGLGGTLLRVDEFIAHNFPWFRGMINKVTPEAAKNLLDKFYFGYSVSWDFDSGAPGHGIISGVEIRF